MPHLPDCEGDFCPCPACPFCSYVECRCSPCDCCQICIEGVTCCGSYPEYCCPGFCGARGEPGHFDPVGHGLADFLTLDWPERISDTAKAARAAAGAGL